MMPRQNAGMQSGVTGLRMGKGSSRCLQILSWKRIWFIT